MLYIPHTNNRYLMTSETPPISWAELFKTRVTESLDLALAEDGRLDSLVECLRQEMRSVLSLEESILSDSQTRSGISSVSWHAGKAIAAQFKVECLHRLIDPYIDHDFTFAYNFRKGVELWIETQEELLISGYHLRKSTNLIDRAAGEIKHDVIYDIRHALKAIMTVDFPTLVDNCK
jgi:hypothetical protein